LPVHLAQSKLENFIEDYEKIIIKMTEK